MWVLDFTDWNRFYNVRDHPFKIKAAWLVFMHRY